MTCNPSPKRPDCHRQRAPHYPLIIKMILCTTGAIGWTHSAMAQTQGSQTGDQSQSAEELGKRAANPLSAGWLMQTQQNNNWVGMPLNMGDRVQSELLFQPLVNAKLTQDWTLFARPVLTLFNSTPFVNPSGRGERATAFGDTVLAFAVAPRPFFGGHLTVAAGPTFIFPTASDHLLGQHTWQLGPDLGVVWSGKHFIAFVFPQQWFKIGGGGAKTNQLSTLWDFTYFFKNGWSIATEPNFLVNWQAPRNQRLTFPIGPQIGKLCKCGHTPTLFQLQFEYYPVHPSVYGPKWNIQLQITPTISPLIKRAIF
jgi:hypothetical protein